MTQAFNVPFLRTAFRNTKTSGGITERVAVHLVLALIFMVLAIWFHSGTLSPESAVLSPANIGECGYTGGTDHAQHINNFRMIKGDPVASWGEGVLLRRSLYQVLAFPLMIVFGFVWGGFLFNLILHSVALVCWAYFLFATIGRRGAVTGIWLIATWPGIFYWAGLPYSYAVIVPFSILAFIILYYLSEPRKSYQTFLGCLAIGTMIQAYDSLFLFGLAVILLTVWQTVRQTRRPLPLLAAIAGFVLPPIAAQMALAHVFKAPTLVNSNSIVYIGYVQGYLSILKGTVNISEWLSLISDAPMELILSYFRAALIVLPVLFLILAVINRLSGLIRFHPAEIALGLVILALFLFNNLAPSGEEAMRSLGLFNDSMQPDKYQLRTSGFARLYQPEFIIFVFFAARMIAALRGRGWLTGTVVTVPVLAAIGLNAALSLGGIVANWHLTSVLYYNFQAHVAPDGYQRHLDTYGRRPLGFCLRGGNWPQAWKSPE